MSGAMHNLVGALIIAAAASIYIAGGVVLYVPLRCGEAVGKKAIFLACGCVFFIAIFMWAFFTFMDYWWKIGG